jgi:hypothetical protein
MFPHHAPISDSVRISTLLTVFDAHLEAQRDRLSPDIATELVRIHAELRRLRDAVRRRELGA